MSEIMSKIAAVLLIGSALAGCAATGPYSSDRNYGLTGELRPIAGEEKK